MPRPCGTAGGIKPRGCRPARDTDQPLHRLVDVLAADNGRDQGSPQGFKLLVAKLRCWPLRVVLPGQLHDPPDPVELATAFAVVDLGPGDAGKQHFGHGEVRRAILTHNDAATGKPLTHQAPVLRLALFGAELAEVIGAATEGHATLAKRVFAKLRDAHVTTPG